jgi:hypothetical protein
MAELADRRNPTLNRNGWGPTPRWYPLRPHADQFSLYTAGRRGVRIIVAACGRRSGKTELCKRDAVNRAHRYDHDDAWVVLAAPTRDQAKRVFWHDLKRLIPPAALLCPPHESTLTVEIRNRAGLRTEISVVGMDRPERIEGRSLDHVVLDEFDDMKADVWPLHVRPALDDPVRPLGTATFIGTPNGRSHIWQLRTQVLGGALPGSEFFHWSSETVLSPEAIAELRATLDEQTFRQEVQADFVHFGGRAYYSFERETHQDALPYDQTAPLVLCFDFNVKPGVAAVLQESRYEGNLADVDRRQPITMGIGEVWIGQNSRTHRVCEQLIRDWGTHRGPVIVDGDATGGARHSSQGIRGTDWDIIRDMLRTVFGERLSIRVQKSNPSERARVNAMNSRLRSMDRTIRFLVDPKRAPHLAADLDEVAVDEDSGELDKKANPMLTHLTDAVGYFVHRKHPIRPHVFEQEVVY